MSEIVEKDWIKEANHISYTVHGTGKESILLFHGFGQSKNENQDFITVLARKHRVVAIDLPFHGASTWRLSEKKLFLKELVNIGLSNSSSDKFHVIGYSLGGHYALSLVEKHSKFISSVTLIAADGLKRNIAQQFFTQNGYGQRLFLRFIQKPNLVFGLIDLLTNVGIFPKKVATFYKSTIDEREKRVALFRRWYFAYGLIEHYHHLHKQLNSRVKLHLIFGTKDLVIPVKSAQKLHRQIPSSQLTLLEKGHLLMTGEVAGVVVVALEYSVKN